MRAVLSQVKEAKKKEAQKIEMTFYGSLTVVHCAYGNGKQHVKLCSTGT